MIDDNCAAMPIKRSLLDRTMQRLYPNNIPPHFERIPVDCKNHVVTKVFLTIGWKDRLRILFSGSALVEMDTMDDGGDGKFKTISYFTVTRKL